MVSMPKVRKAVIAAAGFGTRFLPQTKAMPKEMLPLVDKPIIQHVVEELVAAGIKDIIIVTGYSKRSIEDHFDRPSADLIANLKQGGKSKEHLLEGIEAVADLANFAYVRQKRPLGNAAPLIYAQHLIGDEPFIYTWSDDFIKSSPVRFKQMVDLYDEFSCPIMSAIRTTTDVDFDRYGFADGKELRPGIVHVDTIAEKPGRAKAPSNLATVSGFVLTPDIFNYIEDTLCNLSDGEELVTNDVLMKMCADGKQVIAAEIQDATYYDAGDKLEYLKTVFDFALEREDIGEQLKQHLRKKLQ
jgi:UTP--glucose-1-phosphate uridylyltransferase